ncbi:putative MFS-type transporter YcaD [Pseudomonas fluorescens]|jgi:MFS family permease|uniref:MFS transporter n=1 Tax=Pseudomonas tensinigenes TaxID=2745511 RepID=A0ABX8PUX3_9PSED|nr:MFS transporter [Pseudomonas tensinigenes]PYC24029.1 MFS transporter [Pseudomonas jessenii]QXI04901.1 MFS transporter [Pseudomonas tensinigenes]VVM99748.1 putative MFS-type transporter YcaD [Pseudomonas fluorescens]VVN62308.1 putative MFS-type transporter YcaD [Pseudomonas fluorescens]
MRQIWKSFRALYFASLMMLIGSGLLSTYLALRLAADNVDGLWVGALMAANYFGLVLGGKIGHRLIARVGHIRAYSACAGIVGAAVLGHGLVDWLPAWLVLRTIVGLGMMCQYMVIESWLNEQADANQRGLVFSGYMIASYLGLVLGQLILVMHPGLGLELLMLVALCFALCLVPVTLTRRIHPAPLHPAPMEPRFFIKRVPQSLSTVLGAGLIIGSFYGLAPLYASQQGLSTEQVGLFMGSCIFAGLLVQWPLGWLSDRYDRALLIRCFAGFLAVAALPLAVLPQVPLEVLFGVGFLCSLVQFCLYPLAVAFSNDHVEGDRRVSLTAMLLVTYGVGASIGPLLAGVLMKLFGSQSLYAFFSFFALVLVWRIRPKAVTNLHQVDDAPLHHVAMPDSMSSSPLVAALDPRVDEQVVQEQMVQDPVQTPANPEPEPATPSEPGAEGEPDTDNPAPDLSGGRP